jgi:L-ribulokinase
MYGAMAAGHFSSITEAASKMAHLEPKAFHPDPEANLRYGELYKQYIHLHDYFGRSADSPMKTLKSLRRRTDHS